MIVVEGVAVDRDQETVVAGLTLTKPVTPFHSTVMVSASPSRSTFSTENRLVAAAPPANPSPPSQRDRDAAGATEPR